MKKNRHKDDFLNHLRKIPIVQVASEKSGLSRNSIYRWRNEDQQFADEMDKALTEGEEFVSAMSESQLLNLIKEKSFPAIRFWLKHRSPKFRERIEVTTKTIDESLTPEQEAIAREALKLSTLSDEDDDTKTHS